MRKIIGYRLISSSHALGLTELIEGRIKDDWELYGFTFLSQSSFYQAMVKYDVQEMNTVDTPNEF
jgi:hypothetical protein